MNGKTNSEGQHTRLTLCLTALTVVLIGIALFLWDNRIEEARTREWQQGWQLPGAEDAVKNYPNEPNAHSALASVWMKDKQYNKAAHEYRIAVKLNPVDAYAHLDLGNALYQTGKVEEAIAEWKTAIDLNVPPGDAAKSASSQITVAQKYLTNRPQRR